MSDPPVDPEVGAPWEAMVELVGAFEFDAGNLAEVRSLSPLGLDELLAKRAFTHEERAVPGPAGDVVLSVFTPEGHPGTGPGLFWIHGGGMVMGTRFMAGEALDTAAAVGAVVTSVEYRLAPEHPHPGPLDDCSAALAWVAEHAAELGIDPARLVLAGGSAGGGIAAGVALRVRDEGGPPLVGLLLLYPMLDDRMVTASCAIDAVVPWNRASNEFGWRALLGDAFGTDDVPAHAAPGRATDLSGLPPTFVDVGSVDLFRDEDVAFASAIWAAGGDAELHVWAGAYHGSESFAPDAALSVDARQARARWLARILARPA